MRSTRKTSATLTVGRVAALAAILAGTTGWIRASESDLSTALTGPTEAYLNQTIRVEVGYANAGPETAGSAYINAYIPSGVPAPIDELTQEQYDALLASTLGTDTLGNEVNLTVEPFYCEHFLIQLQRADDDDESHPVEGLDPGVEASFGFELEIPMEPPEFGRVAITEPESIAREWRLAITTEDHLDASSRGLYSTGTCDHYPDSPSGQCNDLYYQCFGPRISRIEPIDAEFELIDDGVGDPTDGCEPIPSFTPGNIAVISRGNCDFDVKNVNAEIAGAAALLLINSDQCRDSPSSDQCVLPQSVGALVWWDFVPMAMISKADGEPLLTALQDGMPVGGFFGRRAGPFKVDSLAFSSDENDTDINPWDNQDHTYIDVVPESITPPEAWFTYAPAHPTVGNAIHFTDSSTQGPPTTWLWDFGDGIGTSTEQNPSYTYTASGTYNVYLTVANTAGFDTASRELSVIQSSPRRQTGRRIEPDVP